MCYVHGYVYAQVVGKVSAPAPATPDLRPSVISVVCCRRRRRFGQCVRHSVAISRRDGVFTPTHIARRLRNLRAITLAALPRASARLSLPSLSRCAGRRRPRSPLRLVLLHRAIPSRRVPLRTPSRHRGSGAPSPTKVCSATDSCTPRGMGAASDGPAAALPQANNRAPTGCRTLASTRVTRTMTRSRVRRASSCSPTNETQSERRPRQRHGQRSSHGARAGLGAEVPSHAVRRWRCTLYSSESCARERCRAAHTGPRPWRRAARARHTDVGSAHRRRTGEVTGH